MQGPSKYIYAKLIFCEVLVCEIWLIIINDFQMFIFYKYNFSSKSTIYYI